MKHLVAALILLLGAQAWAADFGCGRDTDRNGTVDNWCPSDTYDQDYDGVHSTDGDCDDNDWQIRPGISTGKGCSAGQWRTCKADGTGYTSCTSAQWNPLNTDNRFHTDRGYDTVIYIDAVNGNNSTGNGSFANPYQTLEKVSTGGSGAVTINDGTIIVVRAGTYNHTWGANARIWYQTAQCPTKGCAIVAYPGELVKLVKTSTTEGPIMEVSNPNASSKWTVAGFEVDGEDVGEGVGISFWDSGDGHRIFNNYVHNIDGEQNNNLSGIRCYQDTRCNITHNFVTNVCDSSKSSCSLGNTGGVECQKTGCQMNYNVVMAVGGDSVRMGWGLRWKHANNTTTPGYVIGNYVSNVNTGILPHGRSIHVYGNLLSINNLGLTDQGTCTSPGFADPNHYFGPVFVKYNTCYGTSTGIAIRADRYRNADGSLAANACSGTYDPGISEFTHNVIQVNNVVFNVNNGYFRLDPYGPDANRSHFYPSKMTINHNCYHNTGGHTDQAFNDYSANIGDPNFCAERGLYGARYTFANWQSTYPSFDANSFQKNPNFDSIHRATDSDCSDKGYIAYMLSEAPPSPSGGGFLPFVQ